MTIDLPGLTPAQILEAVTLGAQRAFETAARDEFRKFLEEYFGVLDKEELAAVLGVSERTIEEAVADGRLAKDTLLGPKLPRFWMPAIKEALAASRKKERKLRVLGKAA